MRPKIHKNTFAKKSFGQNFLIDKNYVRKIVDALELSENETVVEIGAGRGALTEVLLKKAEKVIAIELDKDLIPVLNEKFAHSKNFDLVESDVLKLNFGKILKSENKIKLAANLPYNISTAVLQNLIEQREVFSEMVLMFQREVVERITAEPGKTERGFLTVLTEAYFEAEKLFDVPPDAFRPVPKVWSSVVRLKTKNEIEIENYPLFKEIISTGFAQKRKTIFNNLKNFKAKIDKSVIEKILEESGINPQRRAETLTLDEWKKLYLRFEKGGSNIFSAGMI